MGAHAACLIMLFMDILGSAYIKERSKGSSKSFFFQVEVEYKESMQSPSDHV